ncbi:MAG: hypothetical protein IPM99_18985 [Rubrivivax sp.]|nr:hypothetical protein [Rubrivivax sp.]
MGQPQQLPLPEVADSDFGAFAAAVQAQQASPADRLLAHAKARSTADGYTSWPAYAERLERIVISLMATEGARP